jgi:hypothetical protein
MSRKVFKEPEKRNTEKKEKVVDKKAQAAFQTTLVGGNQSGIRPTQTFAQSVQSDK